MEQEKEIIRQTTIRVFSDTSYRFNFIKMRDKFKNQDSFLKFLLDIYEKIKLKKLKGRQRKAK
jgi:hypothetical protein